VVLPRRSEQSRELRRVVIAEIGLERDAQGLRLEVKT